ncbi:MAG TPA: DUF2480 family protein [Candidatus Marinimicrobia bacterium]|nr:DUF2480 family protein [Candidatus Neomarinimicrobiota bacterium]HIB70041.1 DUF2480 family protein [Candidatus Neomarinimicrobiota bacterium]HIN61781.1 DUF2480 family protein [Candidatus Neomarinimicrobiota bacterium]HIO35814.1 DUF2480 family protein [Candidatus Neomarinimicrobiota bacterium]HIO88786.1 DUF2480 family protein [Candidatus Neomarinimicrobiota bacterium]
MRLRDLLLCVVETIHLDDFLHEGVIKEKVFREKIAQIDWTQYQGKRVLLRGCANVPVPTWAFLIITAHLAEYVDRIYFGELRSAVKIFVKGSTTS